MQTESIFDVLGKALAPSTKVMPLAAIWLDKSIMAETTTIKPTRRICQDMRIRVEGTEIVDITESNKATHQITECRGTLNSSELEISVIDLKTQELSTIKI
jgi:hypothetical protein